MTKTATTSLDVAKRAGVSRSAVSRVFTPGASVSSTTAQKVRKAATELGYRPNVLARAVKSGKSRMIGLVVAYLENQFYPDAMEKLSNVLQDKGYHVLVFMASQRAGNIDSVVDELLDYQVDGIIAASVAMSSDLADRCTAAGVPMVLFNRSQDELADASVVTSDNLAGGRKVAEFLLAGGHERIAYIAGWEGASTQRDREAGFVQALNAAGKPLYAREVGNFRMDEARAATLRLFVPDKPMPDAVFVANDHMALEVMDTLRIELALQVPDEVSVVGYDDVSAAAWRSYSLTTVRQPVNRMISATVETLLSRIDDRTKPPHRVALDGPLIVRGSARIPEGWKHRNG